MNFLKKIFQEADIILFYAYIWQIPFAWRFILVPNRGIQEGIFNEYMDISLYIGEFLLTLSYLIYKHKNKEKSILIKKNGDLFHVEQLSVLAIGIFLIFNVTNSIDPLLSLISALHFLFIFLAAYLFRKYYVSRGTKVFSEIGYILVVSLLFQLFIACTQIYIGQSIGLKWLSESILSIEQSGIAKSEIFGKTLLRGYGTFPHPNVFSAYALFIVIYFLFISKLFHVKQFCLSVIFLMVILSSIAAQSKLSTFFILVLFFFSIKNKFHVELRKIFFAALIFVVVLLGIIFRGDIQKSLYTRLDQLYLQNQYQEISVLGSGMGTYRLNYDSYIENRSWWLFEPVHNILYISFYELGWLGIVLVLIQIGYWATKVPRETNSVVLPLLFYIIFMLLTDHYGWDIYQGQQLLIVSILLYVSSYFYIDKNYKM